MNKRIIRLVVYGLVAIVGTPTMSGVLQADPERPNDSLVAARSGDSSTSPQRRRRRRRSTIPMARPGSLIPQERVLEIQRALIKRKYLKEATGVYDAATVAAMKAFQAAEKIAVTGYPTAHALDRLEIALGPTPKPAEASADEPPDHSDDPSEAPEKKSPTKPEKP